jgi:hypothetical protein
MSFKKTTLVFIALFICLSLSVFAKRGAPPHVPPVIQAGLQYEVTMKYKFCGSSENPGEEAFVTCKKTADSRVVWETEIYQSRYNCRQEIDVQMIFPAKLELKEQILRLQDERGGTYEVDIQKGTLLKPKSPVVYKN